jgi:hypothetical protein
MGRVPKNVLDLPVEERALLAFRAAVKEAITERARRVAGLRLVGR